MGVDKQLLSNWVSLSNTPHLPQLVATGNYGASLKELERKQYQNAEGITMNAVSDVTGAFDLTQVKITDKDFWKVQNNSTYRFSGIYCYKGVNHTKPVRLLNVDHAIQHLHVTKYI